MPSAFGVDLALVDALTRGIDGWLSPYEGAYLYALAGRGRGTGAIVEIGSYHGKSTVLLAHASKDAGRERVVAIDPYKGAVTPEFRQSLRRAGVEDHVDPLVATSDEVARTWSAPIRLLWIDGGHGFEQASRDFQSWTPFVVPGGIFAFHDSYQWDGVRRVVDEQVIGSGRFALVGLVDSIAAFRNVDRVSIGMRTRNAAMTIGRRLYWMHGRRSLPGDLRRAVKAALRGLSQTA